jgi:hypothetical protein
LRFSFTRQPEANTNNRSLPAVSYLDKKAAQVILDGISPRATHHVGAYHSWQIRSGLHTSFDIYTVMMP